MCTNFDTKWTTLNFWPQICAKIDYGEQTFKSLSLDSKSASLRCCEQQCSDKTDNFEFSGRNLPKYEFWDRNLKNLSLDSESASLRYCVHQFSDKTDNF